MYTIRKYSDGTTEIGQTGGYPDSAAVHVVRRPVSLFLLCALVLTAAAVLYYHTIVLRGIKYDGLWVLEPGKRVVRLRTDYSGCIRVSELDGSELGKARWSGKVLELEIRGEKHIVAPHKRLMIGSSVRLRRVHVSKQT